jgi:hypothetical protein
MSEQPYCNYPNCGCSIDKSILCLKGLPEKGAMTDSAHTHKDLAGNVYVPSITTYGTDDAQPMTDSAQTPLTDAEIFVFKCGYQIYQDTEYIRPAFARTLEKRIAALEADIEKRRKWNTELALANDRLEAQCRAEIALRSEAVARAIAAEQLADGLRKAMMEKDAAAMELTASLLRIHEDSDERIPRDTVASLVTSWRMQWDKVSNTVTAIAAQQGSGETDND